MNEETVAALIAEHWPLDAVTIEQLQREEGGPLFQHGSRETLAVHSDQGDFVVKVFEDAAAMGLVNPSTEQIGHQLYAFDYLSERNYPHIPAVLKTLTGNTFIRAQGKTLYIMERIQNVPREESAQVWRELGAVAAGLRAFRDYPYPYPIAVSGVIGELTAQAEVYSFKEEFLSQVAGLHLLEVEPDALIHGEINMANSLTTESGRTYLLDWDAVGHGPSVLMAGYPLLVCFVNAQTLRFQNDWATAFFEAYTAGEGMTEAEKELTFQAGLLHSLRYLSYNPTPRWARIQFALANQAILLDAIPTLR
jgi:hypothetical protein